jgi:hypothetical protein
MSTTIARGRGFLVVTGNGGTETHAAIVHYRSKSRIELRDCAKTDAFLADVTASVSRDDVDKLCEDTLKALGYAIEEAGNESLR